MTERLFGMGVGPERWGWASLVLGLALCVVASVGGGVGVSAVQLHAEAQTRAAALEPFRFAEIGAGAGAGVDASAEAATEATVADAPAPPAAAKGKGKKKNKHIKYKTIETLAELPWREIEFDAAAPSKRSGHSVTAVGKRLFVFGGCYLDEVCYNDLREYNTKTDVWTDRSKSSKANSESMSVVPSVRSRHTATVTRTADGAKIIVFGGSANELYRNDVFIYDVKKNAWAKPVVTGVVPKARAGHAAAMWHGRLYVTGGYTPDGYANDLAVLDTTIMAWSAPPVTGTPPTPRAGHSLTRIAVAQNIPDSARAHGPPPLPGPVGLDAEAAAKAKAKAKATHKKADAKKKSEKVRLSERLVLFGGANDRGVNNDLFIFDAVLMTWSQPAITGLPPAPRHDHVAATRGHNLWLNGGCDIRKLTCYNDTVVLDTDSLTWKDPMYAVKLKVPYLELVADPDDVLANIRKHADAVVKKDDARRAAKRNKNAKKKKRGFWDKVKSTVSAMKFRQTESLSAAEREQQLLHDAAVEAAEDRLYDAVSLDERNEQLSAATSADAGSAPRFVERALDAEETAEAAAATDAEERAAHGDAFVETASDVDAETDAETDDMALSDAHAFAEIRARARASADDHKQPQKQHTGPKRRQRKRHTDKSKPKNSAEEDPVKDLTPRGGHSGAFVGPDFYVLAGCYLEEKCAFDLMYLHIPKKLKPQTRNRPPRPHGTVRNGQPSPAPVASTKSIAELLAAQHAKAKAAAAKAKAKAAPKHLTVDSARVAAALMERDAAMHSAHSGERSDSDSDAQEADAEAEAEELEAPATAFLQGSMRTHTAAAAATRNARSGLRIAAATKLHAKATTAAKGRSAARSGDAEAEAEAESESESESESEGASESDSGSADFEMDITAEAASRERVRLMDDKRTRLLRAVREYHESHPQKGDRDLTAEQRDMRDAAEVQATIDADLHGGIGLYTDGELQIGNYTSKSAFKSMTDNKLFLPLTITIGILVIGCLAMLFVWLWMRDKEADADLQRQREADAKAQAAAALAMPQGLDPLLASDPGARAALAKDIAAHKAADAAAAAVAAAASPEAQSDREALLAAAGAGTGAGASAPSSRAVAVSIAP